MTISIDLLAKKMRSEHKRLDSWRETGKAFRISGGMAYRIAKEKYEPKNPHIRHVLGLPALIPAPACPVCGDVHVSKRCPKIRKPPKRWSDCPVEHLRWAIENRVEM
jgi:hypothetical protein